MRYLILSVTLGLLVSCALPHADPADGVVYSCYDNQDCSVEGYTCSGIIQDDKNGACVDDEDHNIQSIELEDRCFYPFCRREQDPARCGDGLCRDGGQCVITKHAINAETACLDPDVDLLDASGCAAGDCAEQSCVFDLPGWAAGSYQNDEQAWKCADTTFLSAPVH